MMQKLLAIVSGKVQMAGYRSKVVTIARAFGLNGYVRNLQDGRVKILAEGPFDDLNRFLKAIRIENTLIKVDDIQSEFSDALGAYDDFFKVAGENETDARLDVAAGHLKELIVVVKDGFKETVCKLGGMDGSLKEISQKQDEMIAETRAGFKELSGKQDEMIAETRAGFKENNAGLHEISTKRDSVIDAIDEARADVVSEVKSLRSDLKVRMDERLQRIEGDVTEIKARMRP
jgi:acylphosphatase